MKSNTILIYGVLGLALLCGPAILAADTLVAGFSETIRAPYDIRLQSYNKELKGQVLYINPKYAGGTYAKPPTNQAYEIVWKTAAIPKPLKSQTVTLVWTMNMTGKDNVALKGRQNLPLKWNIFLGEKSEKPLITFNCGIKKSEKWQHKDVSLSFKIVDVDGYGDLQGIMGLTLPAKMVKAGEPLILRVAPKKTMPAKACIILFDDPQTLDYFRAQSLDLGTATQKIPRFNGYREIIAAPYGILYNSFRRAIDKGHLLYLSQMHAAYNGDQRPDLPRYLQWKTAPVDAMAAEGAPGVLFVWSCGLTGPKPDAAPWQWDICLGENGLRRIVTFDGGINQDHCWTDGDVSLWFTNVKTDEWGDTCGLMSLLLPARMVTPGESATLTLRPHQEQETKAFYILYQDATVLDGF